MQTRWFRICALAAFALLIAACGSDPGSAPASQPESPGTSETLAPLSERVALRVALERKNGSIYDEMIGEPTAIWGSMMTFEKASDLIGSPLHPDTTQYESKDDLVWYFVMEGQIVHYQVSVPGWDAPEPTPKLGVVGNIFDAFAGSTRTGSSSQTERDIGQSQMPKIEVPADIYEVVIPTVPPSPPVTPAPPATPAPSPYTEAASLAGDPEIAEVAIGRVTRRIGDVQLPDPDIPGFNLFSFWAIEVDEFLLGGVPTGEVVLVVNEGDANADGIKFRGARFPVTVPVDQRILVFLRRLPTGWPPLGSAAFSLPWSPDTDGIFHVRAGTVDVTRSGEPATVDLDELVEEVIRIAGDAGKVVGRTVPPPTPTPSPPSMELEAADGLQAAIDSLPEIARVTLADGVFGVIPGHVDRLPVELDPVAGTDFAVYHVPSGSWSWFHEHDYPIGRAYKTLEAIEAIESVVRNPELVASLRERVQ